MFRVGLSVLRKKVVGKKERKKVQGKNDPAQVRWWHSAAVGCAQAVWPMVQMPWSYADGSSSAAKCALT